MECCKAEFPHTEHQLCYHCGAKVAVPEGMYCFPNSTCCPECDLKLQKGLFFRFKDVPRYDLIRQREE